MELASRTSIQMATIDVDSYNGLVLPVVRLQLVALRFETPLVNVVNP
jgi:hypothetical protein